MTEARHVLVVDVGKTNAKLALVEVRMRWAEVEGGMTRPNRVLPGPPYPHAGRRGAVELHARRHRRRLHRRHRVDALVVTTHGATGALVDAGGGLALPVLDYERASRTSSPPPMTPHAQGFAETRVAAAAGGPQPRGGSSSGSSRALPRGDGARTGGAILTYPQYWTRRLCGVAAVRAHFTRLPHRPLGSRGGGDFFGAGRPAGMARGRMPPGPARRRRAGVGDRRRSRQRPACRPDAGPLRHPQFPTRRCCRTCGRAPGAPFAVVSTGTWVGLRWAVGAAATHLDPARDTLLNVNAGR